jgi:hypothetical protein
MFIFSVSGLEFVLLSPYFPVVHLWYWTAGIILPVAFCECLTIALAPVLIYFTGNSLEVWFFFRIAALTSKRSLVLMPESSAEEITVCPGKHPSIILLDF